MALSNITGNTRLLGLIADPISQARSPALANELLLRMGRLGDSVLVPMHASQADLEKLIEALRGLHNFDGAIVSMPHKCAVIPLLNSLTPEANMVGAVNVIRRTAAGQLVGTTLDGEGFVAGLEAGGHTVHGATCLLLGAGGAAASIAFALAKHGCKGLTIQNRTSHRAEALASRVSHAFPQVRLDIDDDSVRHYDLLINATSLGMRADDPLPVRRHVLSRAKLVAECVLAPEATALLHAAQDAHCAIHPGLAMLQAQMMLMLRFMGVQ